MAIYNRSFGSAASIYRCLLSLIGNDNIVAQSMEKYIENLLIEDFKDTIVSKYIHDNSMDAKFSLDNLALNTSIGMLLVYHQYLNSYDEYIKYMIWVFTNYNGSKLLFYSDKCCITFPNNIKFRIKKLLDENEIIYDVRISIPKGLNLPISNDINLWGVSEE